MNQISLYHYITITIIGPPAKRYFNADDVQTLYALRIFRGCGPVLLTNPIALWFFQGAGGGCPDPCPSSWNVCLKGFCVGSLLCSVALRVLLVLQSYWGWDSWLLYFNCVLLARGSWCSLSLTRSAVGWPVVCDLGISLSYSHASCLPMILCLFFVVAWIGLCGVVVAFPWSNSVCFEKG